MKLQTILFPNNTICDMEELYLHREGDFIFFDGYFNLFYLEKHHKYCSIDRLTLELVVRGVRKIVLMHDTDAIKEVRFDDLPIKGMDRLKGLKNYLDQDTRTTLELPYNEYKEGVFWFKAELVNAGGDYSIRGHFEAQGKREVPSPSLAVNICTFKRETYVSRNMRSLVSFLKEEDIDNKPYEVTDHMQVFIVDNGQTLSDNAEFNEATKGFLHEGGKGGRIRVIKNANTGGTGGFSRGMKEAMGLRDKLGLTHLLMMDDDAVFDPDLFVRLFGFLSLLRAEYQGITVGGALMREDHRYIQHAAGEWYENFKVKNDHPLVDMRSFETCTEKWVTSADNEHPVYGAWWCCCYHMDAVNEENMPLPIFVHHDDIQFGLKNLDRGIVFLNGICVWHQGFELVFPGVKQYYNMRNTLITSYLNETEYLKKNMKRWSIRRYIGVLISYRYGDCEMIYRGLMDFLKGKKWLLDSDPELLHKKLMADYSRICPKLYYEQIKDYVVNIERELSPEQLRSYYSWDRFKAGFSKMATFNGWILKADDEVKVITPLDSPWDAYRHKNVLLYEPGSGNGFLMKKSFKELIKGIGRIICMSIAIDIWKAKGGEW